MTATDLLTTLRGLRVRLKLDGDRLRVSAPKGALTPEIESELARYKPDLIEILRVLPADASGSVIRPVRRDAPLPLSSFQRRLWVLARLDQTSTAYNLVAWMPETGSLNAPALQESLTEIVRRHEILRTNFHELAGEPALVIGAPRRIVAETIDLTDCDIEESEQELARVAGVEARRLIDLSAGDLFRPIWVQLAGDEYALMIVVHHIIIDAWSMGLVLKEWQALYEAAAGGRSLELGDPPIQHADYAAWQQEVLDQPEIQAKLGFWVDFLRDVPTVLTLPSDRPRGATQTFDGGIEPFTLDPQLAASLKELCHAEEVTPFMAWLAVFGLLLSRYSGQRELLVGSPVASRALPVLGEMIGPLVNTVVFKHRQLEDDTGRTLLARTRENMLAGHAHQDVPFEKLVEIVPVERTMAHPPLFQVACAYHNQPGRSDFTVTGGGAMYELTLNGFELGDTIGGSLEYNTALFDQPTAARMVAHFQTLLRSLVEHPEKRVDELRMLPKAEAGLLLDEWAGKPTSPAGQELFIDGFEGQAARAPDRTAAACGEERCTYAELNNRANRLAQLLQSQGVDRGTTVAIVCERSLEMLIAALAVMKASAVYVPLDPEYPAARLRYILEDSSARLVVTTESLEDVLPLDGIPVIYADGNRGSDRDGAGDGGDDVGDDDGKGGVDGQTAGQGDNPQRTRQPDDLAYVIYTSGTTGKPKGVEVTWGGLSNVLRSLQAEPGLGPDDVLVAVTTFAFDIAGVELFLPLLAGATVVIARRETAEHGKRLRLLLAEAGATVMQATPASWQMLIDAGWGEDEDDHEAAKLRAWCGGEALPRPLAAALLERCAELWNLYGPTETTIWSTLSRVEKGGDPGGPGGPGDSGDSGDRGDRVDRDVPIGRPIANTEVYVLDPEKSITPIGVPGELHIGGAGLARGYRDLPELTDDRFIPHPIDPSDGARVYRTGDLARWNTAGQLEFLGRLDHQVKVRGHRIELGEVESVLLTHPAIRAAAAAVWNGRIVAYVVFRDGREETASDVRRFLRTELPEYMIPGFVQVLSELPMTPNLKIDRGRLPDPQADGVARAGRFVAPEDGIEKQIAEIWSELLGGETPVGAHDNFFDLGGHSLLALKAVYRIEQLQGKPLDARAIFFETLRQIAAR